jgi:hypothetical protein
MAKSGIGTDITENNLLRHYAQSYLNGLRHSTKISAKEGGHMIEI